MAPNPSLMRLSRLKTPESNIVLHTYVKIFLVTCLSYMKPIFHFFKSFQHNWVEFWVEAAWNCLPGRGKHWFGKIEEKAAKLSRWHLLTFLFLIYFKPRRPRGLAFQSRNDSWWRDCRIIHDPTLLCILKINFTPKTEVRVCNVCKRYVHSTRVGFLHL
jgi:hypothetical protein